ncbi:MAG: zinc-binding dehydrogenase, partial [Hyphomicrobiales bacterium]
LTLHNVMMLTPMWKGLTDQLKRQADIVGKALRLLSEGKLKLLISGEFPLADAARAQTFLSEGKAAGKVVLRISS